MVQSLFSETDIQQILQEGLTVEKVLSQLSLFAKGATPVRLNRPCTVGDGIIAVSEEEIPKLISICDKAIYEGRILKFVPASGAASRMFKDWYKMIESGDLNSDEGRRFIQNLERYSFLDDLRQSVAHDGGSLEDLIAERHYDKILNYILNKEGLNYGSLPKALIKFHRYNDAVRTALEEHLVEAIAYTQDMNHLCRIHFSVSEDHQEDINVFIADIKRDYESRYGVSLCVTTSPQRSFTKTIAADSQNHPMRDIRGCLVFRPGGHGALLENLNNLDGDVIFLKNIDNVVPDRLRALTVLYKKILGGYLIKIQNEIFKYLHILESNTINEAIIKEIFNFCETKLCIELPSKIYNAPLNEKSAFIYAKFNRPIRVCGMVKNQGEPGGGPFWVDDAVGGGDLSLQIVEESQIDSESSDQKAIWSEATHFNPVDLVCGVRDYKLKQYDLHDFVDQRAFYISMKTEKGKQIKALELPGLWNGSMAFWNTIFLEVPIETFNPVKMIDDLLRPQHLNA